MSKTSRIITLLLAFLFLATSAAFTVLVLLNPSDDSQTVTKNSGEQEQLNKELGEDAVQGNKMENFEPIAKVESLQIIDVQEGTGATATKGATVTAHYTGALAVNGTIFQSSHDGAGQPIQFDLDGVIQGWSEGVPGMKVGGKRRLIIPAAQAYGSQSPSPDIPADSDLVFDIELVAVN